ncbi:carbohydrate ABC transporter permease [Cellulomonas denverensis]|uniref:Sugar ABC transporter permease n=1 Tax=Cellulomonas denverensis TaxID=264297 RepID=A0A7X6KUT9_9CELL|nr:sugar ABC transporter permease [Cellulomonas denverensis]NKY22485.1 sugar ABC transporter permease [Cellulomonas denverensis]GIG25958.1 sugar ABC transporter permease [Cellulomonas denverensis]
MATSTAAQPVTPGSVDDPRPPRKIGFRQQLGKWDVKLSPYLYISPFFILFAVVGLFPLLYTAWVSVHEWSLLGGQGEFIGLENFQFILGQPNFWKALGNTFSIFVLSTVPQMIAALIIAAMLDANLRAKTFWRMGVLLPYVVAPVAVALIFSKLFADGSGVINTLLGQIGIDPIGWHSQSLPSHIAIATMVNFRWTGYNALIFLAAMQAVPRDLYEAATIDGAARWRQFRSITIPMLRPTVIFVVITSTIGGLQIYDEPRMFDQAGKGGSSGQWLTLTLYLRDLGWRTNNLGRAAAVAWLLFLVIIVFAILNFTLTRLISSSGTNKKKKPKVPAGGTPAAIPAAPSPATTPVADPVLEPGSGSDTDGTSGRTAR